jgi:tetratricopeptide (TPR) repeat protein
MEKGFASTGHVLDEIVGLLSRGLVDDATSLYCRCQEDIGYPLVNHVQGNRTLQEGVANMLYHARDYPKAALVCENLGEFAKAAVLYERADDYGLAAEMYTKVGNVTRAAEMFEKNQSYKQAADLFIQVGNYERAAVNFERAVNHFLAGKLYFEINRLPKAMELLQKVSFDDHDFYDATDMITRILAQNGYPELAMRKLLTVIGDAPVSEKNVRLYARLGDLYVALGQRESARKTYNDVLGFDFQFSDVAARLTALDAAPEEPVAVVTGTPLPAVPAPIDMGEASTPSAQIVSVMEGFDFLKNLPLFAELSLAELKAFYNLVSTVDVAPGHILVEQGRPGEAMFIVKSGAVDVMRVDGGVAHPLATLGPGAHVGEMALVDDAPTSARVVARTSTTAFRVDREAFQKFMFSNDHMALRVYRVFVRTLCTRLRETTERLTAA